MYLKIYIGQFFKQIGQIAEWLKAVSLARFYNAIHGSAGGCPFGRCAEQPVLAANSKVTDGAFANIVG